MPHELSEVFSSGGPLARAVPGFRPRQAQFELAQAIETALHEHSILVAEAGTGTGKTWAYLVPAMRSAGKVLISTGTRTLQDQLFARDFPRVRDALGVPVVAALLKGRSNYVCHYYLARVLADDRALHSRAEVKYVRDIQVFAQRSVTGDKADLPSVPEDADIWHRVSSTRENCLGQECPHVRDCFVLKARRKAQEADIVVVNHALFMADLALREEGVAELLPDADLVIFDEAHQLPDVATRFLGASVSSHQLLDLARQVEQAGLAHAREACNWSETGGRIAQATREWRLAAAPIDRLPGKKARADALPASEEFIKALDAVIEAIEAALQPLELVAPKHPDLISAGRSALELHQRLQQWRKPAAAVNDASDEGAAAALPEVVKPLPLDAKPQLFDAAHGNGSVRDVLARTHSVRWVESSTHSVRLHSAPLSVAKVFSSFRRASQSWVFTSATLSVKGDFAYFQRQLGLDSAHFQSWNSPFDYPGQALLFVPDNLPLPNAPQFNEKFVQTLVPLIRASTGGVLVLCTTLRAVDQIADLLEEQLGSQGIDRLLMRQGESSRGVLLERFRQQKNAVLVGSASFWEGVDAPGDMLTLVAIDKLPFAPPDDPVLQARLDLCRQRNGNPFMEYQVPDAAIALKQGAGRLIRTERDWGVLMVGDSRLVDKPYGRVLWQGLPPFSRTRHLDDVIAFYEDRQAQIDAPAS